ncbi:hypothetical protein B835_900 [Enterococcus mundtii 3F]|nr:hypothetical protein [Enterococcus mundtii 3F]
MEKGDMMKLPTLFSAVLLMSSTEINTTMAFQLSCLCRDRVTF